MKFNVPQFIDIEDKIAFQLTAKQLGWFVGGGVVMFIAWSFLARGPFIITSIIVAILCAGLAFYRPCGVSLLSFIIYGFTFIVKPKVFVWRKDYTMNDLRYSKIKKVPKKEKKKTKERPKDLKEIINNLDSQKF